MHPHTPQERHAFENKERETSPPPTDRKPMRDRRRDVGRPMLAVVVLLAAIIVLIVLL
jgi:hypothetical protein